MPVHLRHIWDVPFLPRQTHWSADANDEFPLVHECGAAVAESLYGSWLERHSGSSANFTAFVSQTVPDFETFFFLFFFFFHNFLINFALI